jgi:RimJ/RimL family protein N-acetyltransferase
VASKDAGELIGWCGLAHLENTDDIESGYAFAKRYWGHGFASEAGAAVIKYGFEALGLDRIVAIAWPENIASRRVMDHLSMTYVKMHRHRAVEVACHAISREEYLRKSSNQ